MPALPVEQIHVATALVYIAGVEIPVTEVSINYGVGQIPQASIAMPADEELYRLGEEDKVPVAIFFLDQWYSPENRPDTIEPTFRLLFDGEITGWEYTESVDGDSVVFTATSHAMTLGQMFAKFLTGDVTETTRNEVNTAGTDQGIVTDTLTNRFPLCLFKRGIFQGGKNIERPFDFVDNLLLPFKIGGYPKPDVAINPDGTFTSALKKAILLADNSEKISAKHFKPFIHSFPPQSAAMQFFVKYCHKTRFDRRWIATPLEQFLTADVFGSFNQIKDQRFNAVLKDIEFKALGNLLQNNFGVGDSFWNLLEKLYSVFVYEILCLPTAPYLRISLNRQTKGIPFYGDGAGNELEYRLGGFISKPTCYFTIAPECNIIFPSMASTRRHEENYATQVTRSVSGSPFLDLYIRHNKQPSADLMADMFTTVGYPEDVDLHLHHKKLVNPDSVLLYPEEYFKGPVVQNHTAPVWYTTIKESWSDYETMRRKTVTDKNKKIATGQEVNTTPSENEKAPTEEQLKLIAEKLTRDSREIYKRYNQLKHFEARYAQRRGSEVLAFNPYLIPGYSFVRFAREGKTLHTMGMIDSVSIRISTTGSSTSVTYGYGRTMKEVYEQAIQELIDTKNPTRFYAMHPLDPSLTISNLLQEEETVSDYFKVMFYQGSKNRKGAFRINDYLKTTKHRGFSVPTSTPIPADTRDGYEVTVSINDDVKTLMQNYHEAMRKVARPICTLSEYIEFINGGVNTDFAQTNVLPPSVYGVSVPVKIRFYEVGDDSLEHFIKPTTNVDLGDGTAQASKLTPIIAVEDIPDLRRDWVARLERYRTKIYNNEIQT